MKVQRSLLLLLLLIIINNCLISQEVQKNSIGIFYSSRFDKFSDKTIVGKTFNLSPNFYEISYKLQPQYNNGIGLQYIKTGIINKHFQISFSSYDFTANYEYSIPIHPSDSNVITGTKFYMRKAEISFGISKSVLLNDFFCLLPGLSIDFPALNLYRYNTYFYSNGKGGGAYDSDFLDLESKMFKSPFLNFYLQIGFFQNKILSFYLSPFVKISTSIVTQYYNRHSSDFSYGITFSINYNFRKKDK